jgi:hypothetical protein
MLTKEICKKCINSKRLKYFDYPSSDNPMHWNEDDEQRWEIKKCVRCSIEELNSVGVERPIPRECFYYLEHLVCQEDR